MDTARLFLLHAHLVAGIGPVFLSKLATVVQNDFAQCYQWSASDFIARVGCSPIQASALVVGLQDRSVLMRELAFFQAHKVEWCTWLDPIYPEMLRSLYAPPPVLMWHGDFAGCIGKPAVALVGARKASSYIQDVVQHLVPSLVAAGVVVVSGGARGADTFSHQATLRAGGKTIAVLGSGLQHVYPRENARLFDEIVASGGVLLSSFPYTMAACPGNFPARNRIVAGLASMTVVLQAARKSGALITAQCALDAGRDVGAVPGSLFDPLSEGCHALIAQGAAIISSAEDIFAACGWIALQEGFVQQSISDSAVRDPLVDACREPKHFDELRLLFPDLLESILQERLFELQLAQVVEQDFMGRFVAV